MVQKVNVRLVRISKSLYDEILKAKENLNDKEQKKTSGFKKKKWSFLDSSHEIGLFLQSLRENNRKL